MIFKRNCALVLTIDLIFIGRMHEKRRIYVAVSLNVKKKTLLEFLTGHIFSVVNKINFFITYGKIIETLELHYNIEKYKFYVYTSTHVPTVLCEQPSTISTLHI